MNAPAASHAELTVAAWPGVTPRLLISGDGTESAADYRAAGGYQPLTDSDALLEQVRAAGLVGRGGAAFPMAVKMTAVRDAKHRGRDTVVVANGEEGEPASVKDRWLLRMRPHLVLDGLRLAARIVGAAHAQLRVWLAGCGHTLRQAGCCLVITDGQVRPVLGTLLGSTPTRARSRHWPTCPTSTAAELPSIAAWAPTAHPAPSWQPSPEAGVRPPSTNYRSVPRWLISLSHTASRLTPSAAH